MGASVTKPAMWFRRIAGLAVQWVRRQEGIVLFTALIVVLALVAFIKITEEMLKGDTRDFDKWLLLALRDPVRPDVPIGPPWLRDAALEMTVLGGRTVLIVVIIVSLAYLALDRKYGAMGFVVVAASGGGLLSVMMKSLIGRERPNIVPPWSPPHRPAFPAGTSWWPW